MDITSSKICEATTKVNALIQQNNNVGELESEPNLFVPVQTL